jgi:sugar/nucleoside kinase (ribokinase family)
MLNSAVSLGRAGIPVELVSELGNDVLGDMICTFLNKTLFPQSRFQDIIKGDPPGAGFPGQR